MWSAKERNGKSAPPVWTATPATDSSSLSGKHRSGANGNGNGHSGRLTPIAISPQRRQLWYSLVEEFVGPYGSNVAVEVERLVDNIAFMQTLAESSTDGIFIKDRHGRYLLVNATYAYWLRTTIDAMLGKTDQQLFDAMLAKQLSAADAAVIAQGNAATEEQLLDQEDSGRSFITTKVPFRNQQHDIIGVLGIARDITARKDMENELRDSKQFNEQIIASAREGVIVFNADLRYVVWNQFIEDLTGFPKSKVLGRYPLQVFPTVAESGMLKSLERALGGETLMSVEMCLETVRGPKSAWVSCTFSPHRDVHGNIIGVICIVTDIGERKKAEAALRRSQQFNQQVIANATNGVVVYDRELRYMLWNPALEKLSGIPAAMLIGRRVSEVETQMRDQHLETMLRQALNGDRVESQDFELTPGSNIWVTAQYGPFRDADDEIIGVIGVVTDVTARHGSEQALRTAAKFNEEIIQSSLDCIMVMDRELRFTSWNTATEQFTGIAAADVLGKSAPKEFPFILDNGVHELLQAALQGQPPSQLDYPFSWPRQQHSGWLIAQISPLRDDQNTIVGVMIVMRDITHRKKAEAALRESKQFNDQIIYSAHEGIVVYDRALCFVEWNPFMEELRGVKRETLIGKLCSDVFPELRDAEFQQVMHGILQGGSYATPDFAQLRPDGKEVWMTIRYQPLRAPDGEITGILGFATDITARKQAEAELLESHQFNTQIINNAREGFIVYDSELRIRLWNRFMEEVTGLSAREVAGHHPLQVKPLLSLTGHVNLLNAALNDEALTGQDVHFIGPTGKTFWLSARYGPHRSANGETRGVIVTLRDVTSRRLAEQSVRESEERYRNILDTIQDGYCEFSLTGELIFFNEAMSHIYGAEKHELYGLEHCRWLRAEHSEKLLTTLQQAVKLGQGKVALTYEITRQDGAIRTLEAAFTLLRNVEGQPVGFRGITRDITERLQAASDLQRSEQRMRAIWDHAQDAMLLVNDEMEYVDANQAACELYGVTREALLHRRMSDFVKPEKKEQARHSLHKLIDAGERKGQFQLVRPDHTLREIEFSARANVLPSLHLSIMRDVTERARAEDALRSSEEYYRSVVSALEEGILILDAQGNALTCNQSLERILKRNREELLLHGLANASWQLLREDGTPFAADALPAHITLSTGKPCSNIVVGLRSQDTAEAETIWVSVNSHPIHQPDAEHAYAVVLSLTDITGRKQSEEALRRSEQRFAQLFNASPDPMSLTTFPEGRIVMVNQAWLRARKFAAQDVIGYTSEALGIWKNQEERCALYAAVAAHGCVHGFEAEMRDLAGHDAYVMISAEKIMLDEQPHMLTVTRDITERRAIEEQIRQSEEQFAAAFKANAVPMLMIDEETRQFVNVNEAYLELFGYRAEELIGRRGDELNFWVDLADRNELFELLQEQGRVREYETAVRNTSGAVRYIVISINRVELNGKRFLLSTCSDITDRKQAELSRRQSEQRFTQAFNALPDLMTITRFSDGEYVAANEAFLTTFGRTRQEVLESNDRKLNHWANPQERIVMMEELGTHHVVRDFECHFRLPSSEVRNYSVSAELIDLDGVSHVLCIGRDITERKHAEEALRLSEQRFATVFHSSPVPLTVTNLIDGRFLMVNDAWTRTLGYTACDALGRNTAELNLWVEPEHRKLLYQQLDERGVLRDVIVRYRHKEGAELLLALSAEVIELADGKYLLTTLLDLTEKQRTEAKLIASEERFAKAFQHNPQPMALLTQRDHRFVGVNQKFCAMLGYEEIELLGQSKQLRLSIQAEGGGENWLDEFLAQASLARRETVLQHKSGELRRAYLAGELIEIDGEPHILLSAEDITERKQAELELRQSQERFSKAFHAIPQPMLIFRVAGREPVHVNQYFLHLLGHDDPNAKPQPLTQLWADPAAEQEFFALMEEHGALRDWETTLLVKGGEPRTFVIAGESMTLDGEPHILIVGLDVTERQRAATELAMQHEQLRALSARLNDIREEERINISREIHDSLSQSLTSLKLDLAWLNKCVTKHINGEARNLMLKKTDSLGTLLDETIHSVRNLATQLRPSVLDTLGVSAAIEWQVQDFQERTGLECEVWLCPEPQDFSMEKATAVFRILQEILTNIIRHAQATRVIIHLIPKAGRLHLTVVDNGRGITEEELKNPKALGLLGMRERALKVGGDIKFEGSVTSGTTVTATFPLK